MTTWNRVGRALLGRWPSQVATWGEEGIAAFVEELQAEGLTPDQALVGIRMHHPSADRDFPPSVAVVASNARQDPSQPTFDELFAAVYGKGGVLRARPPFLGAPLTELDYDRAAVAKAEELGPWMAGFVARYGLRRLRMLEVDHEEYGDLKRKELRDSYEAFLRVTEARELASIASGNGRSGLSKLDPLAALFVTREQLSEETTGEGS